MEQQDTFRISTPDGVLFWGVSKFTYIQLAQAVAKDKGTWVTVVSNRTGRQVAGVDPFGRLHT